MIRSGALTAALALVLAAPAAAQVSAVEIVAPDNLALTYDGGETSTGSVWVRNGTDAAFAPRFRASVEKADGGVPRRHADERFDQDTRDLAVLLGPENRVVRARRTAHVL